jgi:hypothetical protein
MLRRSPAFALLLLLLPGCSFHMGHSYPKVDGVRLKAKHLETLELPALPAAGLRIEDAWGDVCIEGGPGPIHVEAEVYATSVGDGRVELAEDALVARSMSGQPVKLGAVRIRGVEAFQRLELSADLGDLDVRGARVVEALVMRTGMGDVVAESVGEPRSFVGTSGMGNVDLRRCAPHAIELSSGMGDVSVDGVEAEDARLHSGMGDVSLVSSRFTSVKAATGMGNVECKGTTYVQGDFDSGLGSIEK